MLKDREFKIKKREISYQRVRKDKNFSTFSYDDDGHKVYIGDRICWCWYWTEDGRLKGEINETKRKGKKKHWYHENNEWWI